MVQHYSSIFIMLLSLIFAIALICPLVLGDRWIVTVNSRGNLDTAKNRLRQADASIKLSKRSALSVNGRSNAIPIEPLQFKTEFDLDDNEFGFVVSNVSEDAVKSLATMPGVTIEKDQIARACNADVKQVFPTKEQIDPLQEGLDRGGQRALPLDRKFQFTPEWGVLVDVYILDSGVRSDHVEFGGGRASIVKSYYGNSDDSSHGTMVASIVAGNTVGWARQATIKSIKVLDASGSGSYSDIIDAINWVLEEVKKSKRRSILLLPFSGVYSSTLNKIVNKAAKRVPVIVAAGNDNVDARMISPASASRAITVGSSSVVPDGRSPVGASDRRSDFSNFGSVLDIFASGSNIFAATATSSSSYDTFSGTSVAAAQVAGVVAALYSDNPGIRPSQFSKALLSLATKNVIANLPPKTPNNLLFYGP